MKIHTNVIAAAGALLAALPPTGFAQTPAVTSWIHKPGSRVLLHAHNCYPYHGLWRDRIDRALRCSLPVVIEQDLIWYRRKTTGKAWSIVAHGEPFSSREPTLRDHFFERVRPIVEKTLAENRKDRWPVLVLHLEWVTGEPEHVAAIWALLGEYQTWLCSAKRVADEKQVMPIDPGPILVLTQGGRTHQKIFHDDVPVGGKLLAFADARTRRSGIDVSPEKIVTEPATNFRRWWNNAWAVVERGGQRNAGDWTDDDTKRLRSLVDHAHAMGLWIRFYTLNGHGFRGLTGWDKDYNFGSLDKAKKRWRAAIDAGVDFVATDQYEDFAAFLAECQK